MFKDWAQPVVSKPWATITTVVFWLAEVTDFGFLHDFKCVAWQRAVGVE